MPVDLKLGSIERRQFSVHINDNPLNYPLLGVNFLHGFEYTINTNANIIQFKLVNKNESASPPVPVSSAQLQRKTASPGLNSPATSPVNLLLPSTRAAATFIPFRLLNTMAPLLFW